MRRLSEVALAVIGLALGLLAPPLWPSSSLVSPMLPPSPLLVPLLVPLIATVVGTLEAAALATRRAELVSRRALGQGRSGLVARVCLRGAAAGAVWGLASLLLGALIRQLAEGFGSGSPHWYGLTFLAACWAALIVSTAVGWGLAAAWASRAAGGVDRGRGRRSRWPWAAGVLAAAALTLPFVEPPGDLPQPLPFTIGLISVVGPTIAIPALLLRWGARLGQRLLSLMAGPLDRGTGTASARALAARALVRPAPLRAAALGSIGFVMAVAAALSVMINANAARNVLAQELAPDAVVATVPVLTPESTVRVDATARGWAGPLDESVIGALEADERLIVVRAAATTTVRESDGAQAGYTSTLLALPVEALDAIDPLGLRPMYLDDAVAIGGGAGVMTADGEPVTVDSPSVAAPFAGIERDWAESVLGRTEDSAVLVYVAATLPRTTDAPHPDQARAILAEHDLAGAVATYPDRSSWYGAGEQRATVATLGLYGGPFLAAAVALVVALAAATQRLRAREHATLVALGARASTMRAAAAIEAGAVTVVGALLGTAVGIGLGTLASALNGAGGAAIRAWNLGFDLAQVPWAALGLLAVGAVGAAAGLAALVRVRADLMSPADQLRAAEKEGVL